MFSEQVDGVILFSTIEAKVVHFVLTTVEFNPEITARNRFRWGLIFGWLPLMFFIVPTAIAIINAFASQRATGLVAVAGGLAEVLATFGLIVIVGSEVAAIVMLLRTFSRGHPIRTIVAIISIGCSGLLLVSLGLFLWFPTTRH